MNNASDWIRQLALVPHPEGGYYRETFRSDKRVLRTSGSGELSAVTSIYYLLEGGDFSAFHRIASDELWYFQSGSALLIHAIDQAGELVTHELSDKEPGRLSASIPAGQWFASEVKNATGYCLVSCVVAPGFEFSEFSLAIRKELADTYPHHVGLINRMTRG